MTIIRFAMRFIVVHGLLLLLGVGSSVLPQRGVTTAFIASGEHIIYVNQAAGGSNNGSDWVNAFTDLQDALAAAVPPAEIWVAAGVYKPTTDPGDRSTSFQLQNGVAFYGGFAGTETAREQRDWLNNVTVLSGDIDQNDDSDANGVVLDPDDINGANSYHVVVGSDTNSTAVLDGFTITAGQANDPNPHDRGGGMVNNSGSPTLANVVFSGNQAAFGGGMFNDSSSPTLTNITFNGNQAENNGGGIYNLSNSNPILIGVIFSGNQSGFSGGGMFNANSNSLSLVNVAFSGNRANDSGGGIFNSSSSLTLTNVTFSANYAINGGGMFNSNSGNLTLTNVTFSGNQADSNGGGIVNSNSSLTLTNITFSGNRAAVGGGMRNLDNSQSTIQNSVFWHNQDNSGVGTAAASIANSSGSTSTIRYSLVQGCKPDGSWDSTCGTDGGNNLTDEDPLFVNIPNPAATPTPAGNLRLRAGSPANNAGHNGFNNSGADLAGNVRIVGGVIDLGAYESPATTCPAGGVRYVNRQATQPGDGLTWASGYRNLQDGLRVSENCEIWVAAGVYQPSSDPSHRSVSFQLGDNVALYGGFAGTEFAREQRDWLSNVTVLSGDIDDNDNTDANGVVLNPDDINGANSYQVVVGSGTDGTAVLDGFIITAGQANGSTPHERGGGMVNNSGSPTLANVVFSGNQAAFGGGMFNDSGTAALTNVAFNGNRAQNNGGGMYNSSSSPTLTNVTFSDNQTGFFGGGIYNFNSNPILTSATFSNNQATFGGGMLNESSSPTLANVTFSDNHASNSGGGIFNGSSGPTLTNVTFSGNQADSNGGGMNNSNSSSLILVNIAFNSNQANGAGGGVYNNNSSPTMANVTFSDNNATQGGGMLNDSSSPTLTNVTFSGNQATLDGGGMFNNSSSPTLLNVAFSGNQANSYGGGMLNSFSSNPILINATFSGNHTGGAGGGMSNFSNSHPTIRNSVFWHNQDGSGVGTATASIVNDIATATISYSLTQGCNLGGSWLDDCGADGGDNLADADPLFVVTPDPAAAPATAGNLRLQAGSPAIDAGNNAYVTDIAIDLDGNSRVTGPAVDLGPYESNAYLLLVDVVGQGTVTPMPDDTTYPFGTVVAVTAVADSGWTFSHWSSDLSGAANPATITMDGDKSITATFTLDVTYLYLPVVVKQ